MLSIIGLLVSFVLFVDCQGIDKSFCDPDNLKPNPSIPDKPFKLDAPASLQYHMNLEQNDGLKKATFELDQYYDGPGNRAVTTFRSNGGELRIYVNGSNNERYTYIPVDDLCVTEVSDASIETPIPEIKIDGVSHIVPMISLLHLLNPTMKEVYMGKTKLRNIACVHWGVCLFDPTNNATQKLLMYFTDPDEWTPAFPPANVTMVPVGAVSHFKLPNGTTWTSHTTITKYRRGDLAKEDVWNTPDGVYCENRSKGKALPKIAKAFSFRSQVIQPDLPIPFDVVSGSITDIREIYNSGLKLFRFDYVNEAKAPITEVHDFNTGLKYMTDRFEGNCSISTIDPNGVDATTDGKTVKIRDPEAFFNFDSIDFQYTGQKVVGNVMTDAWVGKKLFNGFNTTWQWNFMADGWYQESKLQIQQHEPYMLTISFPLKVYKNDTNSYEIQKLPVRYNFYDFDETGLDLFEFNIMNCFDGAGKRQFQFNLPIKHRDVMQKYKTNLKEAVFLGLVSSGAVLPIRIQEFRIEFKPDAVTVFFTLLEKSLYYGPIDPKPKELTLEEVSELLNKTISSSKFVIPFVVSDTEIYDFVAEPGSFKKLSSVGQSDKPVDPDIIVKPFCDPNNLKPDPSLPDIPFVLPKDDQLQYHMSIQSNDASKKSTYEFEQYYDGPGNRAVTIIRDNNANNVNEEVRIYVDGNKNERYTYVPAAGICNTEKAVGSLDTPIPSVNINGKEHIIPPFSLLHLLNNNMKEVYTGKTVIQGVPVLSWKACLFKQETEDIQKLSIYMSDPELWKPSVISGYATSVPVAFVIENQLSNGTQWTQWYSVSKFRAANLGKEDIWTTPDGVYCEGRSKGKPLPNVPKAFSFRTQIVSTSPIPTISNIREVYDSRLKLFRIDYVAGDITTANYPITEVRDYNTGIRYIQDTFKGNCTLSTVIEDIDSKKDGMFIKIRDPQGFFDFDSIAFQYVGLKHVGKIETDVWIGKKEFAEYEEEIWQWHFMSDGWVQKANSQYQTHEPVLLRLTKNTQTGSLTTYYYMSDFDESGLDEFQFRITDCYDKSRQKHFMFRLPTTNRDIMEQYKTNLKNSVLLALVEGMAVQPIRIQDLKIDFNENDITATFTVLEKPSFYGPVDPKPIDLSLDNATLLLNVSVSAGKFPVTFAVSDTEIYQFIVERDSLKELEARTGVVVYLPSSSQEKAYSSGQVAGITIGSMLVVLVVFGVIGYVFRTKLRRGMDGGFMNPSFRFLSK